MAQTATVDVANTGVLPSSPWFLRPPNRSQPPLVTHSPGMRTQEHSLVSSCEAKLPAQPHCFLTSPSLFTSLCALDSPQCYHLCEFLVATTAREI